ncbi:MAG TPA: FixH family protein [Flavobacteriales bacterium]|nr:FixH family protein [Flavobacteriales bacterium]
MNWGKGLAMVMLAFIGMLSYFLVRAAQNPEPLITEHYYEQELGYQERINARSRALSLGDPVRIDAQREHVAVTFPSQVANARVGGVLALIRTNDPSDDRTVTITSAEGGQFNGAVDLRPGRYMAQLEWHADDVTYYTEEQLLVQ